MGMTVTFQHMMQLLLQMLSCDGFDDVTKFIGAADFPAAEANSLNL